MIISMKPDCKHARKVRGKATYAIVTKKFTVEVDSGLVCAGLYGWEKREAYSGFEGLLGFNLYVRGDSVVRAEKLRMVGS